MAGLVGVFRLDGPSTERDRELVAEMARATAEVPAQLAYQGHAGALSAAYVGYGFESQRAPEHCSGALRGSPEGGELDIVLAGYLYNDREVEALAAASGEGLLGGIAELYRRHGEAFVEHLQGRFWALVHDRREGRLVLAGDRFGHVPLYVRRTADRLIFATGLMAHGVPSAPPTSLDRSAVALYLMYRHFVGEGTYFREVKLASAATILRVDGGEVHERQYWRYGLQEDPPWRSPEEDADAMAEAFAEGMERVRREPGPMAVPLSGGLDSRAIAGELHRGGRAFSAITFGRPGSRDVTLAQEVTKILAAPHTVVPLLPDYLIAKASLIARRTDGAYPINHGHVATTLDVIAPATVAVDGFTGEILSSEKVRDAKATIAPEDALGLISRYYQTTPDGRVNDLLPDLPDKRALADSAGDAVSHRGHRLAASVIDLFSLEQRQRRFTLNGPRILGGDTRVFCPFWHYGYAEACFSVAPAERAVQRPYVLMHRKLWPQLARIRWNKVGLPPLLPVPLLRASLHLDTATSWLYEQAQRRLSQLPMSGLKGFESYNRWFKEHPELRAFVREVLLAEETLNRGIYRSTAIRQAVHDHEAGRARNADLISLLLGTELFFRQIAELR